MLLVTSFVNGLLHSVQANGTRVTIYRVHMICSQFALGSIVIYLPAAKYYIYSKAFCYQVARAHQLYTF